MGAQSTLWFLVAVGAALLACSVLLNRYVRRDPRSVGSGNAPALFAFFMLLFAAGAAIAGYAAVRAGR